VLTGLLRCALPFGRWIVPLLLVAVLVAATAPVTNADRSSPTGCAAGWKLVRSERDRVLSGVAVVSRTNVWAVGGRVRPETPLAMHWDGARWADVRIPAVEASLNGLQDVDAVSARDVWAVGSSWAATDDGPRVLVMHWNGSRWSVIKTPKISGLLRKVSAVSGRDVWAVGESYTEGYPDGEARPLTMHWDGTRWTEESLSEGRLDVLMGVAAVSRSAAWAVGYWPGRESAQVVWRWSESGWRSVPVRTNLGANEDEHLENGLEDVDALSPTDAWAVGWNLSGSLIEHWDGRKWTILRTLPAVLRAVTAVSRNNVWATGTESGRGDRAFIAHWNGRAWREVVGPRVTGEFKDVDATSGSSVWAVGRDDGSPRRLLIARYGC
jgi:hypothetical protein